MKKGLKLLLIYAMVLLIGTIFGTVFYSLYLNVLNFVAGTESNLPVSYVVRACFMSLKCLCILSCPMLCYYRSRHPYGFLQTLFYILICLLTWVVLYPVVNKVEEIVYSRIDKTVEVRPLSKDIFRKNGNHIYYLLDDFKESDGYYDEAPAVLIDTDEDGSVAVSTVQNTEAFELYQSASPYREILIKDSLHYDYKRPIINLSLIVRRGELALRKGWTFFLGFLSLGFLLCSLYGVTNFYKWKLISVEMIIVETMLTLTLNTVYFYPILDTVIYKLTSNKFFYFLGRYIDDPLLCLLNVVFGLAFITAGVIHFALSKRKKA